MMEIWQFVFRSVKRCPYYHRVFTYGMTHDSNHQNRLDFRARFYLQQPQWATQCEKKRCKSATKPSPEGRNGKTKHAN